MKSRTWSKRIKDWCIEAGTYQVFFNQTIDTLAGILERKDEASERYKESGCQPIVKYTNKAGATNEVTNPALALMNDLDKIALTYWRELGLTPSGYKKIQGEKPKEREQLSGLAAALASIEG